MIKIAVFVEGQTEQILIRDFLLKNYDWEVGRIGIECYTLKKERSEHAPFSYPDDKNIRRSSERFYQIIDAKGDTAVLSAIEKRLEGLIVNGGFQKVIGLRDMFSSEYFEENKKKRCINEELNNTLINKTKKTIEKFSHPEIVKFFFAIMEVEAWFLGMPQVFIRFDANLTPEEIENKLGLDLELDPETTHFHPAESLRKIFELTGKDYRKQEGDVSSLINHFTKEDFEELYNNPDKCASFTAFVQELLN